MKIDIDPRRVNAMHCTTCLAAELLGSAHPAALQAQHEADRQAVQTRIALAILRRQQERQR